LYSENKDWHLPVKYQWLEKAERFSWLKGIFSTLYMSTNRVANEIFS
jgi:hypothetical protein